MCTQVCVCHYRNTYKRSKSWCLSAGHTQLSQTYWDIFSQRALRMGTCLIICNCDLSQALASLERVLSFTSQQVRSLRAWEQAGPFAQHDKPSCVNGLPVDLGLAEFSGCPTSQGWRREGQRTGRPQGPLEAASGMCPFPTSEAGFILWVQRTIVGTKFKGHIHQQPSQIMPKRWLHFPQMSKKNKTQDSWVLSSTYHHI